MLRRLEWEAYISLRRASLARAAGPMVGALDPAGLAGGGVRAGHPRAPLSPALPCEANVVGGRFSQLAARRRKPCPIRSAAPSMCQGSAGGFNASGSGDVSGSAHRIGRSVRSGTGSRSRAASRRAARSVFAASDIPRTHQARGALLPTHCTRRAISRPRATFFREVVPYLSTETKSLPMNGTIDELEPLP
jgi:hypothetical protein